MTTRLNFLKNLFENTSANVIEIHPKGKKNISKIVNAICIGDFISCYLAILRGIDPTPVDIISELKQSLNKI